MHNSNHLTHDCVIQDGCLAFQIPGHRRVVGVVCAVELGYVDQRIALAIAKVLRVQSWFPVGVETDLLTGAVLSSDA
jgi:hypothetical protein